VRQIELPNKASGGGGEGVFWGPRTSCQDMKEQQFAGLTGWSTRMLLSSSSDAAFDGNERRRAKTALVKKAIILLRYTYL